MIAKLLVSAGAMKAGTTWLQKQLQSHPNIRFKPAKEIDYFYYCSPLGKKVSHAERIRKYQYALDNITNKRALQWYEHYAEPKEVDDKWYCSLFEGVPNDVYCADFSNRYALLTEESLAKIQDVAKEVKIIYTLRDPLERLWSQAKFNFLFINDEDGVTRMSDVEFRKFIDHPRFWANAEYLANYQKLINVFGKERVRLFYLEDFVAFPHGSLWNLEKFLDIPHIKYDSESVEKKINKTKKLVMPNAWRQIALEQLQPIYEALYEEKLNHPSWQW